MSKTNQNLTTQCTDSKLNLKKNYFTGNLIITINGIEITSLAAYAKDDDIYDMTYRYHYKFLYSDTLNITCENNSFLLAYISYKNIVSDIFSSFEMDKSVGKLNNNYISLTVITP